MFINLEKDLKCLQKKSQEYQEITQKYLVADSGVRVMNDAFKQILNKKKSKQFFCKNCPKKFLSFPALKEHAKKNHGFQPLQNGEARKRGRPRRDVIKPSDQFIEWEKNQGQQQPKPKRPSSLITLRLESIKEMGFGGFLRAPNLQSYPSIKDSITSLINKLEPQLEENYILIGLEEMNKYYEEDQEFYLEKNYNVSQLLVSFLINLTMQVNDELLRVFITFTKAIYFFIDNFARDILFKQLSPEEYGLIPPICPNKKFHELMTIQTFPLILNDFLEFLPNFQEAFPLPFAARILKEICDWSTAECNGFKVYFNL
ncbi:unnamed protein product [Paramecium primaurelia]|uniref:C2H2-type domain-containing protein n=2 Tax=Paramecium TaxID=5884 RepID=A0A8S1W6P7_9CILI|nr:unnamed protein product [Paramecium primaurelia]CAD8183569.1 unnamed protein product [Paramecium pentaurelia]